jgi:hypothetical protein
MAHASDGTQSGVRPESFLAAVHRTQVDDEWEAELAGDREDAQIRSWGSGDD